MAREVDCDVRESSMQALYKLVRNDGDGFNLAAQDIAVEVTPPLLAIPRIQSTVSIHLDRCDFVTGCFVPAINSVMTDRMTSRF